jgi:ATP-dependent helicase HrpB
VSRYAIDTELPVDSIWPELSAALHSQRRAILIAPPGAGKSTRIPRLLLESELTPPARIVLHLEPRRLAARLVAKRIAEERGTPLGDEVGYQVRHEACASARTRHLVITEGILTRRILADPFLEGVCAVLLDEFHERSIHADLALALLREVTQTVREDLILIVMSATIDPEPIAQFLGGATIVRSEGRTHPIKIEHLPDLPSNTRVADRVARGLKHVLATDAPGNAGDILVFLPGAEEIRQSARAIEPLAREHAIGVWPLHGQLPLDAQARALAPGGERKIVLATNVAETSLTVEGVTTVLDTGLVRRAEVDPSRGLETLVLGRASKASCDQRAGRAGRVRPGRCIRLWQPREDRARPAYESPEIKSADLVAPALLIRSWTNKNPSEFAWFEPPPAERLQAADRLLVSLAALHPDSRSLTPLGRILADLPTHPRLGRLLILGASIGLGHEAAGIAAILSERDIVTRSKTGEPVADRPAERSDLLDRLARLEEATRRGPRASVSDLGLDHTATRRAIRTREALARLVDRIRVPDSDFAELDTLSRLDPEEALLALIFLAYPDRLVRRRPHDPARGRMVGGRGVRIDPASLVREEPYFVAVEARDIARDGRSEVLIHVASGIALDTIRALAGAQCTWKTESGVDLESHRVWATRTLLFEDLPLTESIPCEPDREANSIAIDDHLARDPAAWFAGDQNASAFLARCRFLRAAIPELGLPDPNPEFLLETIRLATCQARSLSDLRRVPLLPLLQSKLSFELRRALDRDAPETLELPSGRNAKLCYADPDRPPLLSAKVQELYGWRETPRIASGRVPLRLEILGPNHRPVQLTSDLASFWITTYEQVRKDLRGRYPKHDWPENPLDAHAKRRAASPPARKPK